MNTLNIFIGYDPREHVAAEVCRYSIMRHASGPVSITYLSKPQLEAARLYWRETLMRGDQQVDKVDKKPFSTDFSFSRFLVPFLCDYQGIGLFMDCDMLVTTDIYKLVHEAMKDKQENGSTPLWCVQHLHEPTANVKMDGVKQTQYPRKNWSSVMLFNNSHMFTKNVTPLEVSNSPGAFLHQFKWVPDNVRIGELGLHWNFLADYNDEKELDGWDGLPGIIHYTEGGPWFNDYFNCQYAEEWLAVHEEMYRKGALANIAKNEDN